MRIQTGQGTIPLITLIGIWSISALNALPGLAVSPILGKLSTIFPHSSELDIQMLSSLPSLLIIPFIILSGKLTEKTDYIKLLQIGLVIFAISGVLYLLSGQMWQLIAVSALLGVGAGLIIPLSTGLISQFFTGGYRTKQFGLSSAITNMTLVLATSLTGFLAEINWHLPFVVYLFPLISIVLSYSLKNNRTQDTSAAVPADVDVPVPDPSDTAYGRHGIQADHLWQIMSFYGLATYLAVMITFNLPFLMKEYQLTSGASGIMISLFFLAIMTPGFFLNKIISAWKKKTKFYCMLMMAAGFTLILTFRSEWAIGLGCILIGFGYGVVQPVAYDKTTRTALPNKITLALAFVMAMNYLAILLCPFIINALQALFHTQSQSFPFILNLVVSLLAAGWAYWKQDTFLFNDSYRKV